MSEQSDAAKKALENLELRQRKFVEAFCVSFNATKAAETAGYSKKTARQQGYRLLTNVYIKNAIKAVLDTAAMDPEEIAARWTALARAGLDDFYTKVEYQERPKVQQPLAEAIAGVQAEMEFEDEYAERAILPPDEHIDHMLQQQTRKRKIIRWQLELERDPAATRETYGPPVIRHRLELDLVKAADLGLLDLVKAITPTEYGQRLELRSPDAALDNLAKWRGMLVNKVDVTSGGEKLPAPPVLGLLTLDDKKRILAGMRQAQPEGDGNG